MDINPAEITDILKREIKDFDREIDVAETGTILSIGDGIARIYGLANAMAGGQERQPARSQGNGAPGWLIWIGILVGINVLSYLFNWGFWIY